jgi:hypothetical protein
MTSAAEQWHGFRQRVKHFLMACYQLLTPASFSPLAECVCSPDDTPGLQGSESDSQKTSISEASGVSAPRSISSTLIRPPQRTSTHWCGAGASLTVLAEPLLLVLLAGC